MAENDGQRRTFSAREIVEEFFPATPPLLIPGRKRFQLRRSASGELKVFDAEGRELLVMEPLNQVGDLDQRLCCDLCLHSAGRASLALHRVPVPGSNGRRWRYVTACRDEVGCESRRRDDAVLDQLLAN